MNPLTQLVSQAETLGRLKAGEKIEEVVKMLFAAGLIVEAKGAALALMAIDKKAGELYFNKLSAYEKI